MASTSPGIDPCSYELTIGRELHRCAVGCLLSPAALSETVTIDYETAKDACVMQGTYQLRDFRGSMATLNIVGYQLEELDGVDWDFLEGAQVIHDDINNWETGKFNVAALDEFAERHGLKLVSDEPQGAPREAVLV